MSSKRVWEARTGSSPAEEMLAYSESTEIDEALLHVDLAGSVAHTIGLQKAGLVDEEDAAQLVAGLQALWTDAQEGSLALEPDLEDVHMNVESALQDEIGDLADELHTGRSRNDQVALDLVLAQREGLAAVAAHLHDLAQALAALAEDHAETPWTMQTHGIAAQPATLGFLLHAHASRIADDVDALLDAFDDVGVSPLGAGAGAGSTLPLQPEVPADLLGLDPFDNALLAAGARDESLLVVHELAQVGHHLQALAVDLLELTSEGAIELPSAYTTGSSIMPHKVNPDALELARADGAKLGALAHETQSLLSGLGLGYDRDLQRAKAPVLEAFEVAESLAVVLASVVDGLTVHPEALATPDEIPGVATTDAAEALVQQGIAFRQAHQILADATSQASEDTTIADALEDQPLSEEALEAAKAALDADPAHRDTPGGPAPDQVQAQLDDLTVQLGEQETQLAGIERAVDVVDHLLDVPAEDLIEKAQGGPT